MIDLVTCRERFDEWWRIRWQPNLFASGVPNIMNVAMEELAYNAWVAAWTCHTELAKEDD